MSQETGIVIEVSDNGSDWAQLVYLSADVTSYQHTGIAEGTTKFYRIKAVGDGINTADSPYSSVVSATTGVSDTQTPTAPTALVASNVTANTVSLSWQASSDNTGVVAYEIYQAGIYIDETADTSYSAIGLSADSDYSFTVKARDAAGNLSAASNTLNVRTQAAPANYAAESLAVFAHYTGANELTTSEKDAIDRFIKGNVQAGNWAKIHAFMPMAGLSTAAKALIEWKSGVSGVNVGSTPYAKATGFTTDGAAQYINTNINPASLGVALNDAAYGAHCIQNNGVFHVGCIGSNVNGQMIIYASSAGAISHKHHQSNTITGTYAIAALADTLHTVIRETSAIIRINADGQQFTKSENYLSNTVPDRAIYAGARNQNGTANTFGASSYGTIIVHQHTGFRYFAFQFYWEQLLMELGVKTKSELYSVDMPQPSYSTANAMVLNSEGQSNSLFAGAATGLTQPELTGPIAGTNVFWRNPFTNPLTIEPLHYLSTHTYDSAVSFGKYAAGMRVAYELANRQNLKLYVWMYGKSGTPLAQASGADWNPVSTGELLYDSHVRIGQPGLALVTEPIDKIIWHWGQGEADAGDQTQQQYTSNFYLLLKTKIDFYEQQGLNLTSTKLHVVLPRIGKDLPLASYPNRDAIIAAQNSFSVQNFEAVYPAYAGKVASLKVYGNDKLLRTDGTHLNPEGYHIEGYRLAAYMMKL